ncbi:MULTISPECIES: hypothetical protein [Serratia]|jgi:hypothetical protein|uniref:hypothetical protein n=1 Tax=Serratia TaxID=613 RepID=UPI0018D6D43B|nr:hypothetical protein [Serratia marcescens]MBH2910569.1 hypothetical protein [Serratia marcescens]HCU0428873.1 hypothetical protein [Serratia marcescens]
MTVFAVIATDDQENMKKAVSEKFSTQQFLEVGDSLWLIDSQCATTRDLTMLLCGEDNSAELSSFIVLPVTSYFGLHNKLVWEWLNAKGL